MNKAIKLVSAEINNRKVDFFEPPHPEPDFPWVNVHQLARAFMSKGEALVQLKVAQKFGEGTKTISHNGGLVTIACHALAQGFCAAMDCKNGSGYHDDGPIFMTYSTAAAQICVEHWPMGEKETIHAFHNPGGPFMSQVVSDE